MGVITQHGRAGRLTVHIIRAVGSCAMELVHGKAELKPFWA